MNKTKSMQYFLMFVLTVTLCLSFPLSQAKAYTCPGLETDIICADGGLANCDSDLDGYSDAEECTGITVGGSIYSMDPTSQDLFLIIVRADDPDNVDCTGQPSLLPADLLYPSTDPPSLSRLGLTVHVISNSQAPDQIITPNQNAVKMTEKCSTANPDVAGEAIPGIPSQNALYGAVFTYVIQNKINNACKPGFTCTDGFESLTSASELTLKHIINTFNHEVGHMIGLSVNIDRKVGNHWQVGTGNELDQFVDCSSNTRKKTASCEISDIHGVPDIDGFLLTL